MNQRIFKTILIALMVITAEIGSASESSVSDEKQIRTMRELSNNAIARKDVDSIVSFLDLKYQTTTGSGKFIQGRELMGIAFEDAFKKYKDVIYVRTPDKVAISKYLPQASEIGNWVGTWTNSKGAVRMGGTYSASWHKVENSWKIRAELFVTLYCEGAGC